MVAFNMHKKIALIILIAIVIVISGVSAYILTSLTPFCGTTRTVVCYVSYNNTANSLFLNVTSWVNKTFVFDQANIKDSNGHVVASEDFVPTMLPAFGNIDLTINLGTVVLPSGKSYGIELRTNEGI